MALTNNELAKILTCTLKFAEKKSTNRGIDGVTVLQKDHEVYLYASNGHCGCRVRLHDEPEGGLMRSLEPGVYDPLQMKHMISCAKGGHPFDFKPALSPDHAQPFDRLFEARQHDATADTTNLQPKYMRLACDLAMAIPKHISPTPKIQITTRADYRGVDISCGGVDCSMQAVIMGMHA